MGEREREIERRERERERRGERREEGDRGVREICGVGVGEGGEVKPLLGPSMKLLS
jgi:hypothetical protein